jgi:hypothetical protein
VWTAVVSTVPDLQNCPAGFSLLWRLLLPGVCFSFLLAVRNLSSSLYITGTLNIAIHVPFGSPIIFSDLAASHSPFF